MPLAKCNPSAQYCNYLITGGPRPRGVDTRPILKSLVLKHFKNVKEIHVAEEDGEQEEHFHIAVLCKDNIRWKSLMNDIILLLSQWKSQYETGPQKPNCSFHFAPKKKARNILEEYLTKPTKDKEVDANILSDKEVITINPPAGMDPANVKLYEHVKFKKGAKAPVFHRMSCMCELCK